MEEDIFYGTKRVRSTGRAIAINIPKEWPFEKDDPVEVSVRKMGCDKTFVTNKIVRKSGTSLCIYCCKDWGMEKDDWVVFSVRLNEDGKTAGRRAQVPNHGVSSV